MQMKETIFIIKEYSYMHPKVKIEVVNTTATGEEPVYLTPAPTDFENNLLTLLSYNYGGIVPQELFKCEMELPNKIKF